MKRLTAFLLIAILLLCACRKAEEPVVEEPTPEPTPEIVEDNIPQGGLSDPAELMTPEPTDTPEPTEEPTPTPDGLLGGRFPDQFSDTPVKDESSYKSKSVGVSYKTVVTDGQYGGKVVYHVADIYVQDVTSLKTESARGGFKQGYTDLPATICANAGALVAINGDEYVRSVKGHRGLGLVIRNGEVVRKRLIKGSDLCVLYRNGEMKTYLHDTYKIKDIIEEDPWQVWNFDGPALLDDGKALTDFGYIRSKIRIVNPRTALGYYEPGHYCFVIVDGRQPGYSDGIDFPNLSKLMADLGCKVAYNMDGGSSSFLYFDGEIRSKQCRPNWQISDIIYVMPEE